MLFRGGSGGLLVIFFPYEFPSGELGCHQEPINCSYSYFVVNRKQRTSLVLITVMWEGSIIIPVGVTIGSPVYSHLALCFCKTLDFTVPYKNCSDY